MSRERYEELFLELGALRQQGQLLLEYRTDVLQKERELAELRAGSEVKDMELSELRVGAETRERELSELRAKVVEFEALPWWRRLFWRG